MERSARRRFESVSRHLLSPRIINQGLHHNPAGASEDPSPPVIVGGMVLDIHAKPSGDPARGTTIPGRVEYVNGGVARNIAECMSKIGSKPFIISVLGLDMAGDLLLKYWESAGLSMQGILKLQEITTPVVMNLFDRSGEVAAGVASVEAVETFLTPDWIQQFRRNISSGPALVVDANLHPQSLKAASQIAAESGIPVWFEPVSVAKSTRISSVINFITCTTPNEKELIAMANALSPGRDFSSVPRIDLKREEQPIEYLLQMLKPAIHVLLEKGIKLLVVTLGSDGVLLCFREGLDFMKGLMKNSRTSSGRQIYELVNERCPSELYASYMKSSPGCSTHHAFHFPALAASVVSLTGAGDCLVGGIVASICSGLDVMQSTAVGIAAAKAAVETESNVPTEYYLRTVAEEAQKVFMAAKPLVLD